MRAFTLLTSENLNAFVEAAQSFLGRGSVDLIQDGSWYGEGLVTVEAVQMGDDCVVQFTQCDTTMCFGACLESSPARTYYRIEEPARLVMHVQLPDGTSSKTMFRLKS